MKFTLDFERLLFQNLCIHITSQVVRPTSSLRTSLVITRLLADPGYLHWTWSCPWLDFLTWAQICLLSMDLSSTLDSWLNTVTIAGSALLTLFRCCGTAALVNENFQMWTYTHKLWQVLLSERNETAFIITLLSFMILELTPNVYFFTMLLHEIIAGLSCLHLYGTWMHFLLLLICLFHYLLSFKPKLVLVCWYSIQTWLFTEEYYNFKSISAFGFSSSLVWFF